MKRRLIPRTDIRKTAPKTGIPRGYVTVIGAGVSGLTTAVVLQEAGFQVDVIAREFSPDTTSDLAGALWYPSHAWPLEKTRAWGLETLEQFLRLNAEEGAERTGIHLVTGTRHFYRQMGSPWWRNHVPQFRVLTELERPERARTSYEYTVPLIDMPSYLGGYLKSRLLHAGGTTRVASFEVLPTGAPFREPGSDGRESDIRAGNSIVVNCTGLGSFSLLGDKLLYPVRGQVHETKDIRPDAFTLSADHPDGSIYVIPRSNGVVVGGGSRSGVWDTSVDDEHTRKIHRQALELAPEIASATHWESRVGLRPGRKTVRCEQDADDPYLFHNYGHTGAGVTLSWGCAREVLNRISEALGKPLEGSADATATCPEPARYPELN